MARHLLTLVSILAVSSGAAAVAFDGPLPTGLAIQPDLSRGWSANPTDAPRIGSLQIRDLFGRQLPENYCGYLNADINFPNTCNAGQVCAFNSANRAQGCCLSASLQACSIKTSCVESASLSGCDSACQSNGFILKCSDSANSACFTNRYVRASGTTFLGYGCNTVRGDYLIVATATNSQSSSTTTSTSTTSSRSTSSTSTSRVTSTTTEVVTSGGSTITRVSTVTSDASMTTSSGGSGSAVPGGGSNTGSSSGGGSNVGAIVGGVVGGVAGLVLIVLAALFLLHRRKKNKAVPVVDPAPQMNTYSPHAGAGYGAGAGGAVGYRGVPAQQPGYNPNALPYGETPTTYYGGAAGAPKLDPHNGAQEADSTAIAANNAKNNRLSELDTPQPSSTSPAPPYGPGGPTSSGFSPPGELHEMDGSPAVGMDGAPLSPHAAR